ncbi:hypothetical protein AMS68_000947 [Peltaster fructicola]|uniref:DNA topoisomerase I n=1 Tax=Peltaster fructicola TaxID=286661 RepID=A0A6H0XLQ1_9PEZI|nr:hypothetical protein AMS68_000947 [Peltaster fructicola]
MSDSEDDKPLVKAKSKPIITKAMDSSVGSSSHANDPVSAGVSIAMGPVTDTVQPVVNGISKRKSMSNGRSYKDLSSDDDDDDDVPLTKKRKTLQESATKPSTKVATKPAKTAVAQIGDDSDDDVPLGKKMQEKKAAIEKRAEKEAKAIRQAEKAAPKRKVKDSDSDDAPLVKKQRAGAQTNGVKKVRKPESDDDDVPLSKKAPAKKVKKESSTPQKTKSKVKTEEDQDAEDAEEEYRWWEDPSKGDGSIKWTTLEHNGVVFPPEYVPLPKNVSMFYDGQPVFMQPEAEEIAYSFGSMLHSEQNVTNPVFQKNFFDDLKTALDKTGGAKSRNGEKVKIAKFEKCDFTKIFAHVDAERQAKKALSSAEKKQLKAEKDEQEAPYLYCTWDGRKQKVGNFRVEPPGLFRGRGEHPKTGRFKTRVKPEQITINIGKDAMVPKPPQGHKWKEVKHDQTGTWLAMWQENINGNYKYVMLAANSDVKGQSDHKKFEKARELKKHIDRIRKDYERELKSEVMAERQRATAMYLIDRFALRAGNEKGEDEADTVGCCSLKFEHITLKPPNTVIFDFLGKDSIRFYNEFKVDEQVFKNLKIFKRAPKKDGDEIFDRLTTSSLNKHLSNYMPGLTAKVFRTYNASWTMNDLLRKLELKGTVAEKVVAYNACNREVAILCNHKRTVAASHAQQMEKLEEKINGQRFKQWRYKQMMLDVEPKLKKKRGEEFFALPEGLDKAWVIQHHADLVEAEKLKITKKFNKDNEKLDETEKLSDEELQSRLKSATELEAKYKEELKSGKVIAEGKAPSVEKLDEQIKKLDININNALTQGEDRENNKEVALGTSKINYIDPRLTVVFSKKFGVPLERFFSKTLREKFEWAIKSVDENWTF